MSRQSSLFVDVQIACEHSDIPSAEEIETWVNRAVVGAGTSFGGDADVSVRVVDKEEIRTLNRDYRQKDAVTNVLSFPAGPIKGLPVDNAVALGDIVLCANMVSDEAAAQEKPVGAHWAHLLVHGTLHLLGYDHLTDADAAAMEGLETRILMDNGLADPYTEGG